MTETFERIKAKLGGKPKTLSDTEEWLFVAEHCEGDDRQR